MPFVQKLQYTLPLLHWEEEQGLVPRPKQPLQLRYPPFAQYWPVPPHREHCSVPSPPQVWQMVNPAPLQKVHLIFPVPWQWMQPWFPITEGPSEVLLSGSGLGLLPAVLCIAAAGQGDAQQQGHEEHECGDPPAAQKLPKDPFVHTAPPSIPVDLAFLISILHQNWNAFKRFRRKGK